MAMFDSFVSLPEGIIPVLSYQWVNLAYDCQTGGFIASYYMII
jgi:hypothetical protein